MKRSEIDAKFDEIVRFAEMEKFLDTPVKRYSSGMYVRLAFAVAAHLEPEILIVDEVLAVGDAKFQKKCLGKMSDVAKEGRTVLFVSHNMKAVSSLCQTGLLLNDGSVYARGTASAMVAKYSEMCSGDVVSCQPIFDYMPRPEQPASIVRVQVADPSGTATLIHSILRPVIIDVEFVVQEPIGHLDLWLGILSLDGSLLFQTCHRDRESYETGIAPHRALVDPGRYRAMIELPAPLLNEGSYELHLSLQAGTMQFDARRGIIFTVEDESSFASSVLGVHRDGYFCMPIPWKIEPVEEDWIN